MYAFCSLFIGRREGGFLYPFTVQHDARKSSSPVTRTIFKEIYKLPDKLCLRVGSFSKFRRPSGPLSFPMSTNDVPGSSLASCNCQQTIFPFSIILDLFHETRGQNLWIQDDQVFFSANLIDDKNGKI